MQPLRTNCCFDLKKHSQETSNNTLSGFTSRSRFGTKNREKQINKDAS